MEGNQMKMREALEFAVRQLVDATESDEYGDDVVYLVGCMRTVAEACRAALAAPARQCDIGTAEEQKERFDEFCNNHWGSNDRSGNNCGMCPLSPINCLLEWSQMPYEAEEGEAKQ